MSQYKDREKVKVAYYYYKMGLTQADIANKMNMSRQRVNRLLKKAVEEKIVEITIIDFDKYNIELENIIEKKFNLTQVIVVSNIDENEVVSSLGLAGAEYLEGILSKGDTIGVTWGKTLSEVAKKLSTNPKMEVSTVQLVGGMNIDFSDLEPTDITKTIASKLGGESNILYAPVIVENKETKDAMMSDFSLKSVFDKMEKCNYIVVGIGELKDETKLYKESNFNKQYKEHLLSKGCIGDIGFRWFDREGKIVVHDYDNKTIGYNILNKNNETPVIGIAGGKKKEEAILGALKGGFIDVLITDDETAKFLINNL